MGDPFTTSIAAAVVAGAAAAVSDGTRALLTKLAGLVREKFRGRPTDNDALEVALRFPGDEAALRRLADLIGERMRDDPAFARQVRALWGDITAAGAGPGDAVTNIVGGQVHGSVVQARDVQGGITFHEPPPSR